MSYPIPPNEEKRLQAIKSLHLEPSTKEDEYTALIELIAAITGCPISLISVVERDRQWFKAQRGLTECGTTRAEAFCSHTIVENELLVVEDAQTDERFRNFSLVTGPLKIRFYAGIPITSPEGHAIGSVCVLDTRPRKLSAAKRKALRVVADKVAELFWLRKESERSAKAAARYERLAGEQKAVHNAALSRIGHHLHEDYAQCIAACMKYMEIAGTSTEVAKPTIERTYAVLQDVLVRMRELSVQINPSHFDQL